MCTVYNIMNLLSRNEVDSKGRRSPQLVPRRSHWQVDLSLTVIVREHLDIVWKRGTDR